MRSHCQVEWQVVQSAPHLGVMLIKCPVTRSVGQNGGTMNVLCYLCGQWTEDSPSAQRTC